VVFDPKDWNPTSKGLENGSTGKSLKIEFEGTRVDVIHFGGDGIADIHIDGKRPSEIPETWSATLPSSSPIDYRPAIMRVGLMGLPEKETWTLTAHSVSNNGRTYNYSVKGSVSGFQGKGDQSDIFQSDNGILQIDPRMITFADAIRIRKKPIPTPFNVTWKTINRSLDQWHCKSADEKNPSGQTTLVQQLTNGKHTLEIIPRSGTIQIEQILIHRPDTP